MKQQSLLQDPDASEGAVRFHRFLFHFSEGKVPADYSSYIHTPQYLHQVHSHENVCNRNHENIKEKNSDKDCLKNRGIMKTRNLFLQILNEIVEDKFPGEAKIVASYDKVESDEIAENGLQYAVKMLNTLTAGSAFPNDLLTINVGIPVMLLHNVNSKNTTLTLHNIY